MHVSTLVQKDAEETCFHLVAKDSLTRPSKGGGTEEHLKSGHPTLVCPCWMLARCEPHTRGLPGLLSGPAHLACLPLA